MNNNKAYKILYYICFIITVMMYLMLSQTTKVFNPPIEVFTSTLLSTINLILVIIFTILIIKGKLNKINILLPILYILFLIIIIIISFIYNNILIYPYIHFNYYISFILFNYLLLNIYSILSIEKK